MLSPVLSLDLPSQTGQEAGKTLAHSRARPSFIQGI